MEEVYGSVIDENLPITNLSFKYNLIPLSFPKTSKFKNKYILNITYIKDKSISLLSIIYVYVSSLKIHLAYYYYLIISSNICH